MEKRIVTLEDIAKRSLSYSSIKEFRRSPEHFLHYLQYKKPPTAAQAFGSLVDKMILTPDNWEASFAVIPEKPAFLKDLVAVYGKDKGREMYDNGKLQYETFLKENAGKTLVTPQEIEEAKLITEKVWSNPAAAALLSRVTCTQNELRWTDKKTGLKMVGYLDGKGDNIILELKTTMNADPEMFAKDCIKYLYFLQAGIYCEGVKATEFEFPDFYYLAVEKTAPYGICVLKADADYINYGKQEYRRLLDSFKYCLANKLFEKSYEYRSSNGGGYHHLLLPGWLAKDLNP